MFRSVLGEVAEGIRSTAEGDLRDLIKKARLPMPLFNPSLYVGDAFLAKPDAWWPDAGVAGEVDSREWPLSPEDWDRATRRHDLMGAAGIIPLHFSPKQIRREPVEVAQLRIQGCPEAQASTILLSPSAPSLARPAPEPTYTWQPAPKSVQAATTTPIHPR